MSTSVSRVSPYDYHMAHHNSPTAGSPARRQQGQSTLFNPSSEEADQRIVTYLESLIRQDYDNVNRRDFSQISMSPAEAKIERYGEQGESHRYTHQGMYQMAVKLVEKNPHYQVHIMDMVTKLDAEQPRTRERSAQTFVTYERRGLPPGVVKQSVVIVRWEARGREWNCVSYERMPGGHVWGGILS